MVVNKVIPIALCFIICRLYANNKSGNKIVVEVAGESTKSSFEAFRRVYFDQNKSYILSGEFL